ncbi:hypothetical protein [Chryseobacterium sp.]|uniref:hypothetical protein n=1 Tax=Chryseobacterium sp. TaxID=1871047 RepID=UPI00321B4791
MKRKSGIFSTSYLTETISTQMKLKVFNTLKHKGFLGYDYGKSDFVDIENAMDSFLEYPRHSFRYKTEDFVLSCEEGEDYLGYSVDGGSDNSKIVIDFSNEALSQIGNVLFSFIDDEGSSPRDLRSIITNSGIKYLFKYNYFGLPYITKFGETFFHDFPAIKVEFLTSELVRVDLTDDIFSSISENTKNQVASYLHHFGLNNCEFYDISKYWYD